MLTIVGGLLLACGFWVTGAGAMFDVPAAPRTVPASSEQPARLTEPTSSTVPAAEVTDVVDAPEAGDVEGGPDGLTGAGG